MSVHDSRDGRLVLAFISYVRRAPLLGFEFCRAGDAHFAARCAPGAPQGDLQTLDEHGLLADRFGELARHGALSTGPGGCELECWRSDLALFVRLPLQPNGARSTSLRPRPDYHPLPNLFCQQR